MCLKVSDHGAKLYVKAADNFVHCAVVPIYCIAMDMTAKI